jgi:hypothetical protein
MGDMMLAFLSNVWIDANSSWKVVIPIASTPDSPRWKSAKTESARRELLPVREESGLGRLVGGGIANDRRPGVLGFEVEELHRLGIHG